MAISTPDLCDEHGDKVRVAAPLFTHFGGSKNFSGEIVTVKCFEDNSKVGESLSRNGKGKVLVVDGGGSLRRSLLGDKLAQKGIDNGWAGIIVNGAIRDIEDLNAMDIGAVALATVPRKTEKRGVGQVNVPVEFAGLTWTPGDFVYADLSGLITSSEPLI